MIWNCENMEAASEEAKLYHNVIQIIYGNKLNTVGFQPSSVVTMISLDRMKEFCIAKNVLELHSAEKTIKGLFEMEIFSSHTKNKIFLTVVSCCAAEDRIICYVLDYFPERKEVAVGIFKSKLQWNCLNIWEHIIIPCWQQ